MADSEDRILALIRKHIAARRQDIAAKFPKNLSPEEYARHCGRYEEVESLAAVVQDAVRKANAMLAGDDDDEADPT